MVNNYVVFDIIGTLTIEGSFINILKELLPNREETVLRDSYKKYRIDEITRKNFWKELNVKNWKDLERKVIDKVKFREGYLEVVNNLYKDCGMGILSNMPKEWGRKLVKKGKFKKYFKPVIFSGDYKAAKPNIEIYEIFMQHVNNLLKDDKIYYVDNELSDLEGASRFDWITVYLNSGTEDLQEETFKPDFVIQELSEINKILRR